MAERGAARQPRRGPAPIASFDHDGSDESSPETKQAIRLPEIREDSSSSAGASAADGLAPPEQRERSQSTPGALQAPPAPRIDISRASSSSHQDSRDSSPELALFAGATPGAAGELGFREDGALDLRSSTEELAFLEPAPGERPAAAAPPSRRHSRKDSQGSEAALLAVSGRTSRLSSVGSQCSAHSALSAFSRGCEPRLSVASGTSRSPSPHRMLLETSFCGPKPIETDPEICAAAVEERLLEMAKLTAVGGADLQLISPPLVPVVVTTAVDARDHREVRTEATVERTAPRQQAVRQPAPPDTHVAAAATVPADSTSQTTCETAQPDLDHEKKQKETKNRARAEERQARSRERRDQNEPRAKSKDIIRIRLKPSEEYDDDDVEDEESDRPAASSSSKPVMLALGGGGDGPGGRPTRPTDLASEPAGPRRPPRDSRTPSPSGIVVSRKSSFCSLFKSRETIASPESPSDALRRKKSLNDGRSRSRSRDRSTTPTSATKIRGSVLSLFRTPRKSATSPSPSSREGSPVVQQVRQPNPQPDRTRRAGERLKYYEDTKEGIIHIPLRTPPDEPGASRSSESDARPASAPQPRATSAPAPATAPTPAPTPALAPVTPVSTAGPAPPTTTRSSSPAVRTGADDRPKPIQRTVLPDGSIIIPLHSPTERTSTDDILTPGPVVKSPETSRSIDAVPRPSSSAATTTSVERATSSESSSIAVGSNGAPTPTATPAPAPEPDRSRKREKLVFMTHVGSRDQVFSTQFSITKTPSVTSEISGSFPSFPDAEETREAGEPAPASAETERERWEREVELPRVGLSPQEARDSSGSEASSEAAAPLAGSDVEQRGLVVQESFEEELPYVPTTLPQERSLALPMVPVRERGAAQVAVAPVERPRPPAHAPRPALPPTPQVAAAGAGAASGAEGDKLRIRLPRRPRTGSAGAPPRHERARTRSGSEGLESRPKSEWIDFSEVPERRKQPTRIQTLPATRDVVFSYVAPDECRCECHARDPGPQDAQRECSEHASGS